MQARVLDQGSFSDMFDVTNKVKQGCVLAPTLFSVMFPAMLKDAFRDDQLAGVYLRERTDGGIFNLRRFQAKTKVMMAIIRELLFADDCAIMAHTPEHIKLLTDCFDKAAKRFGLNISLKKTEVLFQSVIRHVSQADIHDRRYSPEHSRQVLLSWQCVDSKCGCQR